MSLIDKVDIILVEPADGGNVGSCARALKNMGFHGFGMVRPLYEDREQARKMAVHAADLLEAALVHRSIEEATQHACWVVGVSGRTRAHPERKPPIGPQELIENLKSLPDGAKAACIFGSERTGLTNDQLSFCGDVLTWPTSFEYPSLNLSQAVLLVAWEIRRADGNSNLPVMKEKVVTAGELDAFLSHLRRTLDILGYLNPQNPDRILNDLRNVFSRAELGPRELSMIRGIFHRMDVWIAGHGGPPTPNQPQK